MSLTIVIDSSVWISALHFGGVPLSALDLVEGRFRIAICDPIFAEIHAALEMKFNWSRAEVDEGLATYSLDLMPVQAVGIIQGVCRDPKDDVIIECAVIAGANFIVTGDKDLVAVRQYQGIRIVTPREFLDEFEARFES